MQATRRGRVALVVAKVSIEVEVTGVGGLYRNVRYSKGSARYTEIENGKNAKPERSQPTYSKLPSRCSNQIYMLTSTSDSVMNA